jgi:hypothetical protein
MNMPRKHHFIPKSYLSAWSSSGDLDGMLQVIDRLGRKEFQVKPINAAKESDLYMIDIDDVVDDSIRPEDVEKFFGKIESDTASVLKDIVRDHVFPDGDSLDKLMMYIACLVFRVPRRLAWFDSTMQEPFKFIYKKMKERGQFPEIEDGDIEKRIDKLIESGGISLRLNQNPRLDMMLYCISTVCPYLQHRHWTVLTADDSAGDLICTDNPVLLEWTKSDCVGMSPGFGLENTLVFVPVSPRVALLGLWGAELNDVILSDKKVSFWVPVHGYIDVPEPFGPIIQA